jgi:hypothetical protein
MAPVLPLPVPDPPVRPDVTASVRRGASQLLLDHGHLPVWEFTLANGRRADICAVGPRGEIVIVEVKSSPEDFRADAKWPQYEPFCDSFYFAVAPGFPQGLLPEGVGLIVADTFGAEIVRCAPSHALAAARRKALTLALLRHSAAREAARLLARQ